MKTHVWIAALGIFGSTVSAQPDVPSTASADCATTHQGSGDLYYANDALATSVPSRFIFTPDGPGFVDYDGALGIKFPFERLKPGRLFVGGRRLDADAGPARAYIYDYGDNGFQPIYLVFPTPGCWEISAGLSDAITPLTFVVLVQKIGDGPSWHQDAPPTDRRVTRHWRDN